MLERQKQNLIGYIKGARYAINTANSVDLCFKKILDNFVVYSKGTTIVNCCLYLPLDVDLIGHSTVIKRKGIKGKKHKKERIGRLKD